MVVLTYALAILGLSALVVIHELGHYLVARAFGMRVLRFSIGLGPAIFRYQLRPKRPLPALKSLSEEEQGGTIFQICAVPLLAYVQIAGMNPHEKVDPSDPSLYRNKSVLARILAIAAGPGANYLAASVLVFALAITTSLPEPGLMTVDDVEANSPAAQAGLKPGDIVRRANGETIDDYDDLVRVTRVRAGQPTEYVIERRGRNLDPIMITPMRKGERGVIGVRPRPTKIYRERGIQESAVAALVLPLAFTIDQLKGMVDMVKRGSADGVAGPKKMTDIVAAHAANGVADYAFILVLLSVALGLFNLLPVPALDGGRLAFLAYEVITRRRPNERVEAVVHTVGLLFLLGVLVLVTYREVLG